MVSELDNSRNFEKSALVAENRRRGGDLNPRSPKENQISSFAPYDWRLTWLGYPGTNELFTSSGKMFSRSLIYIKSAKLICFLASLSKVDLISRRVSSRRCLVYSETP